MKYIPHLRKGGELFHYRTKGSRNGISNTPGYKPIGKKAVGILNAAGQYIYTNTRTAANNAGNWLNDRGRQINTFVTGGNSRNNAITLRRAAASTRTAGNRLVNYSRRVSGSSNASTIINRNRARANAVRTSNALNKRADEQQRIYDRSIKGRIENTGRSIVNKLTRSPSVKNTTNDKTEENKTNVGKVVYQKTGQSKARLSDAAQKLLDKNLEAAEKKNAAAAAAQEKTKSSKKKGSSKSSGSGSRKSSKKTKEQSQENAKEKLIYGTEKDQNDQNTQNDQSKPIDRRTAMNDAENAIKNAESSEERETAMRNLISAYESEGDSKENEETDSKLASLIHTVKTNLSKISKIEEDMQKAALTNDQATYLKQRNKLRAESQRLRSMNDSLIKRYYNLKDK